MNRLIDEILEDIKKPTYVPDQTDALFLIAHFLREVSETLALGLEDR